MGYFFNDNPLDDAKKTFVDPLANAGKTIMDSNFKDLNQIKGILYEIDESASNVAKSFGQGREQITSIKAAMAEAADKIYLLGGNWQSVVDIQQMAATTLGRNVILASESYEKLYETTKVTGVQNKELFEGFKNAGFSLYDVSNQMQKVMDTARSIGVNAQAVSGMVVKNMSSMNQFNFQGGVEGMAKMAAQAVNLRVDMKSTLDLANKMFDPEQAINMSAAMQRLGVAQGDLLDPLKMMDLAQNDPAELQNQIAQMSKQFVQLNADGHFEIMPGAKRQLMEIGKELGYNNGELEKMALGGAELEQKMGKIKFPEFATKEQQEMLANITEMGANGDMKIKVDGKEMDINAAMEEFGTDEESFNKLIDASKPKKMEDLAEEQLGTLKTIQGIIASMSGRVPRGVAGTKIQTEADDATRFVGKKAIETVEPFSSKNIGGVIGGVAETFITSINNGENALTALGVAGETISTFLNVNFKKSVETASISLGELKDSSNSWLQFVSGVITKGAKAITNHENLSPPSNTEIKVNDFVIKTLDTDKFVMGGGTNPTGSNSDVASKNMGPIDVNLNIKVDAPGMDTSQLMLAFNDPPFKQKILEVFGTAANNANGTVASNSNTEARKQHNV